MNAPGTSKTATFLFSHASTMAIRNTASVEMVGDVDCSFVMYARCLRLSAQPRPLIFPQCFFFRNIKYPNASLFCLGDKSFRRTGCITFRSCNCCISFFTAAYPLRQTFLAPFSSTSVACPPVPRQLLLAQRHPCQTVLHAPSHIA